MKTNKPHIAIIDSGIGGLSILEEIIAKEWQMDISYIADWKNLPYGTKNEDEVARIITALVAEAETKLGPDLFVIACNTASTIGLELVRKNSPTPFVGVVPAIKPASLAKDSFAILATQATASNQYTQNLINQFASNLSIRKLSVPMFVEEAERLILNHCVNVDVVTETLTPLQAQGIRNLVLGCTHFPFLKEAINHAFNGYFQFFDSGEAIARRVVSLLADKFELTQRKTTAETNFYYTGNMLPFDQAEEKLNHNHRFGSLTLKKL